VTDEFVINTPDDTAMKFWIGGAAKSATVAAVFANLILNGKNEGPHVFVVPLRNKNNYNVLPGIIIGDCGKKIGQENIDNGFILFNNFRIPRENMLNRMSNVTREGKFETSIPSPDQRLALILGGIS
jgi:acyl-CoA oxidase